MFYKRPFFYYGLGIGCYINVIIDVLMKPEIGDHLGSVILWTVLGLTSGLFAKMFEKL